MPSYTDLPQLEFIEASSNMDGISALLDAPVIIFELPSIRQFSATITGNGGIEIAHYGLEGRYEDDVASVEAQLLTALTGLSPQTRSRSMTFRGFVGEVGKLYVVDVEYDGESMGSESSLWLCQSWCIVTAPRISLPDQRLGDWLNRRPIRAAASGPSHIRIGAERQGVLIRHFTEGGQFFVQSN